MDEVELELRVTSYGPATTHWWPLSVPPVPVETILLPATLASSAVIDTEQLAAQTISTYPVFDNGTRRDGDPIADAFSVRVFENGACFAVADGCGWGPSSFNAATKAIEGFQEYVDRKIESVSNLREAAQFLLRCVCAAHDKIWDGQKKFWECGSTTLLCAMLLKLDGSTDDFADAPYAFVCVNIGDCKAFVISGRDTKHTEVIDMTVESKRTVKEKSDPGGRIGPYLNGNPDTRNLLISTIPIYPGDTICLVSDGVHDNLDPETLGLSLDTSLQRNASLAVNIFTSEKLELDTSSELAKLTEIPEHLTDNKAWEHISIEQSELLKAEYREYVIGRLVDKGADNASKLLNSLFDHCIQTTSASREFMQQNPSNVHPPDYVTYPGKMDHTTAVIYRVPGDAPADRPSLQHSINPDKPTRRMGFAEVVHHTKPTKKGKTGSKLRHTDEPSPSNPAPTTEEVELPPRKTGKRKNSKSSTPRDEPSHEQKEASSAPPIAGSEAPSLHASEGSQISGRKSKGTSPRKMEEEKPHGEYISVSSS